PCPYIYALSLHDALPICFDLQRFGFVIMLQFETDPGFAIPLKAGDFLRTQGRGGGATVNAGLVMMPRRGQIDPFGRTNHQLPFVIGGRRMGGTSAACKGRGGGGRVGGPPAAYKGRVGSVQVLRLLAQAIGLQLRSFEGIVYPGQTTTCRRDIGLYLWLRFSLLPQQVLNTLQGNDPVLRPRP